MAAPWNAAKATTFMRQCRLRLSSPLSTRTSSRSVSSSHLAPSNFSKPLRSQDTDIPADGKHERRSPSTKQANPFYAHPRALTPPVTQVPYPVKGGFLSFVKYTIFKFPLPRPNLKPPPFSVMNNPYRARKQWPPDFRLLHPKQQFHFEKIYRRRLIVKANSQRYNWNRYTKLLQQSLIVLTLVYFVFIADPYAKEGGGTPVDGFRAWFFGNLSKMGHLPGGLTEQAEELERYYKKNWEEKAPWKEGSDHEKVSAEVGRASAQPKKT